jgi:hypothetical protein
MPAMRRTRNYAEVFRRCEQVELDLAGIERVEPVIVTLEDLTPIAANVPTLRASGLLPAAQPMP